MNPKYIILKKWNNLPQKQNPHLAIGVSCENSIYFKEIVRYK